MATNTTAAALEFPPELVTEMFSAVQGHSTLAKLCAAKPMPFAGTKSFVFSMDGEAEIVGEAEQKSPNEAAWAPVEIIPIKFVYQHRVSEEFKHLSEEARIPYLQAYADGFSKKIARGVDIAGFHAINPKTGAASTVVGNNAFDKVVNQTVSYVSGTTSPDDALDAAIQMVLGNERGMSGIAMAPLFGSAMAAVKANGVVQYPEFRFGGRPESFGGHALDLNTTVNKKIAADTVRDLAIVGDFANAFRWGYAKQIPIEIIEYGDPDGLGDLKRKNQICLRSEAYVGWGILDAASFCRITEAVTAGQTA